MVIHRVKVIVDEDCNYCKEMAPELYRLATEIPMDFIDANSYEAEMELQRLGLPKVQLPCVIVDGRTLITSKNYGLRGKILKALKGSPGETRGYPEKVLTQKRWREDEDTVCGVDIEMDLNTSEVDKGLPKCWLIRKRD